MEQNDIKQCSTVVGTLALYSTDPDFDSRPGNRLS
jgi:hypothetical protein